MTEEKKSQEVEETKPTTTEEVEAPTIKETSTDTTPSISDDQLSSVSDTVSKSVIQRLSESLGLNKKEAEELPTDPESLQKIVDERVQSQLQDRDAKNEEIRKLEETQQSNNINSIIKGWDSQYTQLAQSGKVPAIKKLSDPNDPGVVAKRKMIMAIGKVIEQNKAKGIEYTPTVAEILVNYPTVLDGPPGADLPISGSTAGVSNSPQVNYQKDIAGKSFQQIIDAEKRD